MSIQRVKACAGVAVEKGLGAEGRFGRKTVPGIAENIRHVVAEMRSAIHTRLQPSKRRILWAGVRSLAHSCLSLF